MSHRTRLLLAAFASAGLVAAMPAFADSPAQDARHATARDCARDECDCHGHGQRVGKDSTAPKLESNVVQGSDGYTTSKVPQFTDVG